MLKKASLAGGCFWCIEAAFQSLDGVSKVTSGYMGGSQDTASYKQISEGTTLHKEVIQLDFDENLISYKDLLDFFWLQIDPTDSEGQMHDKGPQYKTAIFYHDEVQKQEAELSKKQLETHENFKNKKIETEILSAMEFYPAEDYHQNFHKKDPTRYESFKKGSRRVEKLAGIWSDFKKKV